MRIVKKCIVWLGFSSLLLFFVPRSVAQEYSWAAVYSLIERRFPKTPTVDIDVLDEWMKHEDVLIIDVREKEEFLLSHVRKAKNWTSVDHFQHVPKEKRIVLYCSVGYRSAKLVQALQKEGYSKVYNLKGSIFAWANAEKPVYREREKTHVVHPYNEFWGALLDEKYHPVSAE